ncbi:MAG: sugar MFS transporter [bacterium]|nr:sugar MFS transporter [bacterium]
MGNFITKNAGNIPKGKNQNYTFALSALITLFFMWGFITCLNDIIIPHLKSLFTLNYAEVMLIQFAFFGAFAVISIPAGFLIKKVGFKNGIVIGLATMALACFLFCPAAVYREYPIFITAFFILAAGITILQVAANPYVALLGKKRTASSRLTLAQAFNSLGTTIAPYLGAILILSIAVKTSAQLAGLSSEQLAAYHLSVANSVQIPYMILGVVLIILAVFFMIVKLPKMHGDRITDDNVDIIPDNSSFDDKSTAWAYKHLLLGAIGIFVYVGAEVSIGSFLVNYINQPFIGGYSIAIAGEFVAVYWGGAMIGRFIGSWAQKKILPSKVLAFNAILAAVLVLISMFTFGHLAMYAILAVGIFNSVMFPTIFCLAIEDLGRYTDKASSILCTACVGGAIVPLAQGFLADNIGIQHAFILPVLCYVYILFYALKGHKHA